MTFNESRFHRRVRSEARAQQAEKAEGTSRHQVQRLGRAVKMRRVL